MAVNVGVASGSRQRTLMGRPGLSGAPTSERGDDRTGQAACQEDEHLSGMGLDWVAGPGRAVEADSRDE